MGQQQLLLLVLGIVIVGLAVVAGLEVFDRVESESEFDAMTLLATDVADDLQAWYFKAPVMGGGGEASCPFDHPVTGFGRTTLTGRPFAANLPTYPAPANATWMDLGGGHYARLIPAQDIVQVVSATRGDLSVELRVHGPDASCRSMRRRVYRGGAWRLDSPHTDPSSCAGLWN